MLKGVQSVLPTRMECSALQAENFDLHLAEEVKGISDISQTQIICTDELRSGGEETKYVYTEEMVQEMTVLPEMPNVADQTLESMKVAENEQVASVQLADTQQCSNENVPSPNDVEAQVDIENESNSQGYLNEGETRADSVETVEYVGSLTGELESVQSEDVTIQYADVTTTNIDLSSTETNMAAADTTTTVDINAGDGCATYVVTADVNRAEIESDVQNFEQIDVVGEEGEMDVNVVDVVETTVTVDGKQEDCLSMGKEVVVDDSEVVIPGVAPLMLPRHLFATQPDESTDSLVDVVGVTDEETATAAVDSQYLECPVPSPPSTIAYGESDDEFASLDEVDPPGTISQHPGTLFQDPGTSNEHPGFLNPNPENVNEQPEISNKYLDNHGNFVSVIEGQPVQNLNQADRDVTIQESIVDIEGSMEVQSNSQIVDPHLTLLPNVTESSYGKESIPPSLNDASALAGMQNIGPSGITREHTNSVEQSQLPTTTGIAPTDQSLVENTDSSLVNNVNTGDLATTVLTTETSTGLVDSNALGSQDLITDQTQPLVNTDDIVIDENEGAQVLMENADGSRFLLNPDGTQVPVHMDEQGNSYLIDADGTAVLLQSAEDQTLTTDIVTNEPWPSQTGISDSGLMETYLNTQVTQTGVDSAHDVMDNVTTETAALTGPDGSAVVQSNVESTLVHQENAVETSQWNTIEQGQVMTVTNTNQLESSTGTETVHSLLAGEVAGISEVNNVSVNQGTLGGEQDQVTAVTYVSEMVGVPGQDASQGFAEGNVVLSSSDQVQYITQENGEVYTMAGEAVQQYTEGSVQQQYAESTLAANCLQGQYEYVTQETIPEATTLQTDASGIIHQQDSLTNIPQEQYQYITQPEAAAGLLPGQSLGIVNGQETYINADGSQIQYTYETVGGDANLATGDIGYGHQDNSGQVDFVAQSMKETGILPDGSTGVVGGELDNATIADGSTSTLPGSVASDTYYVLIDGQYHKINDPQVLTSLGVNLDGLTNSTETSASIGQTPVTQQISQPITAKQTVNQQNGNLVVQYPRHNVQSNSVSYTTMDHRVKSRSTNQRRQPSLLKNNLHRLSVKNDRSLLNNKSALSVKSQNPRLGTKLEAIKQLQEQDSVNMKQNHKYSTDLRSLYGVGGSNKYQSLKQNATKKPQATVSTATSNNQQQQQMYYVIEGAKDDVTKYYVPASSLNQQTAPTRDTLGRINGLHAGKTVSVKLPEKKPASSRISVMKPSSQTSSYALNNGGSGNPSGYTVVSTQASGGYTVISTQASSTVRNSLLDVNKRTQKPHQSWLNGSSTKWMDAKPSKYDISAKKTQLPKTQVAVGDPSKIKVNLVSSVSAKVKEKPSPVVITMQDFLSSAGNLIKEGKKSFVIKSKDSNDMDKPSTVITLVSKDSNDPKPGGQVRNQAAVESKEVTMEMTSAQLMEEVKAIAGNSSNDTTGSFQDTFTASVTKARSNDTKDKYDRDMLNAYLGKPKKKEPDPFSLAGYLNSNLKGPPAILMKSKERKDKKNDLKKLSVKSPVKSSVDELHLLNVQKQTVSANPVRTFSDFMCQANMGEVLVSSKEGESLTLDSAEVDKCESMPHKCGIKSDVGVQAMAPIILAQSGPSITNFGNKLKTVNFPKASPTKSEHSSTSTVSIVSPVKYTEGQELFDMECESVDQDQKSGKKKKKEKIIVARVTPNKEENGSGFHRSTQNDPEWVIEARRKILLEEGKSLKADQNGNKIIRVKSEGSVEVKKTQKSSHSSVVEKKKPLSIVCKTEKVEENRPVSGVQKQAGSKASNEKSINSVIKAATTISDLGEKAKTDIKVQSTLLHSKSCDLQKRQEELTQPKVDPRSGLFEVGVDCKAKHSDGNVYDGIITQVDGIQARCYIDFLDKGCEWCCFDDVTPPQAPPCMDYVDEKMTCYNCRSGRDEPTNQIVICDACGKGFHQLCHSPVIGAAVVQDFDSEWICCICRPVISEYVHIRPLPYTLSSLTWNSSHTENAEQTYCYCGDAGNWFLQMLQCRKCLQWFHQDCVSCLQETLLLGDQFYVFMCSICNKGQEYLHRIQLRWVDIAHLAIFHLGLCLGKRYLDLKTEILPWVNKHWRAFKLVNQMEFDKKQRYIKLEEALSDVHYMNKFRNGKKARKSESCWGLKVRSPPAAPSLKLPLMHPLTPANTKHYRWKPMYKLSSIDSGIVTWNFAQPQSLNRKRKFSENSDLDTPTGDRGVKRRRLDGKGNFAKQDCCKKLGSSLQQDGLPGTSLSLLERKIPELSSYSGVNHPFLLDVERFEIKEQNRNKAIATQTFAEVHLVVDDDITTTKVTKHSNNKQETVDSSDEESQTKSSSHEPFTVLAKRMNSDHLEYLIDWYL